jgi:hypothetical protein
MSAAERPVLQYLERYAEPEARLADHLGGPFGHALVVPASGEGACLLRAIASIPRGPRGDVLVVLVVNAAPEAAAWVHEENRRLIPRLEAMYGVPQQVSVAPAPTHLFRFPAGVILHVDRSLPPLQIARRDGVGLARKIGFDVCLALHTARRVASPFIHSTDADVLLPPDYFEEVELLAPQNPAAFVYPFVHRPEPDAALASAIALYEISLRYYVLGLKFAGSPYAFHTVGSTLAIEASAYAKVRGFPKRNAAEDFYVLSKLAKVGRVVTLRGRPLTLSGRISDRVPFGTGKSVQRIAGLGVDRFKMYDPSLFRYLRAWLGALEKLVPDSLGRFGNLLRATCAEAEIDAAPLLAVAEDSSITAALSAAARQSRGKETFARHLQTWFDAFRTLKLVHALQAGGLVPKAWWIALQDAPFAVGALSATPTLPGGADPGTLRAINDRMFAIERGDA